MAKTLLMNTLPRPTFRWLKNNHTEGSLLGEGTKKAEISVAANEGVVTALTNTDALNPGYEGVNKEALALVANAFTNGFVIDVDAGKKETVVITFNVSGDAVNENTRIRINAGAHSQVDVLYVLEGEANTAHAIQLFTEVNAADHAQVVVKKVQLLGDNTQQLEHRFAHVGKEANVEYINIELGGADNYLNYATTLAGESANFVHDLAYLGDKAQRFDIAMLMTHEGRKTTSDVHNIGALSGTSKKSFRGTLDFLRGSSQAEGAEEDIALLLNKDVKSISLPLLLCKEDNVSGNHAASAGQIDNNKLFYIMSRGFSESEAKHIIVESMLRPIIDRIGQEELEEVTLAAVRNKI